MIEIVIYAIFHEEQQLTRWYSDKNILGGIFDKLVRDMNNTGYDASTVRILYTTIEYKKINLKN